MSISSLVPSRLSARQVLPAIAGIYISQTIITALTTQALPSLLRDAGASLQVAGLTALLWIPWGIRFLWAPAVERLRLPAGRLQRRSRTLVLGGQWLIAAVLLVLGLAALAGHLSLADHAGLILAGLLVAALVAATTDVASDGFTVEQLASQQRGWGNVAQVGGSYVGAMLGAGGFLLVVGTLGWPQALLAAALAIVLLSVPMMLLREPPRDPALAVNHRPGLLHALRRPEVRTGLLLMLLSSIGVRLTLGMFGPFLLDKGLSLEELGWFFGTLHLGAGLTGAVLGGMLVRAAPGWRAVWIAVSLKALVLAALTLAAPTASLTVLMVLVGLMFAALGFVWVALYSALMGLTSPLQSGVDFTLFQSADALLAVAGGVAGGWLSQHLGYEVCFGLAAASAVVAVLVVKRKGPSLDNIRELHGV
ncbi:MFS transporter [Pseudomonas sp. ABC1]|uniref:MFS transporter n=1 Tax=Pseudomonas sp. ABC1 TaxID=2748080 RepID=UPI0015C37A07|nr:MFS transporter [Pseudomonas sp. ABC1]QLF92124.1 MFS transporter [Pseudomonas sp. ABC1]